MSKQQALMDDMPPVDVEANALKLRRAFDYIYDNYPYMSTVVADWRISYAEHLPTMGTNGPNLFINPHFLNRLSQGGANFVILHEAEHVMLGHHFRILDRNPERFNIAADYAINTYHADEIPGDGGGLGRMALPSQMNLPNCQSSEFYYDRIPDPPPGSNASMGIVMPHPAGSEAELQQAIDDWREMIDIAMSIHSAPGKEPGLMTREGIVGHEVSKLDWKRLLRQCMSHIAKRNYSYSRPHRRKMHTGLIFPAIRSRITGNGLFIIDTSGSMATDDCDLALPEIESISRNFPYCSIEMIHCDTIISEKSIRTFTHSDFPLRAPIEWMGRGGTNLDPAFEYAQKNSDRLDWVVCLSDMEWTVNKAPNPGLPTIWLMTNKSLDGLPANSRPAFGVPVGPMR